MSYKDSEEDADGVDFDSNLSLDEKELEFEEGFGDDTTLNELEQIAKKAKAGNRFSLKSRRAIEDHIEQRRLRKEMDYLFDDDFTEEDK